MTSDTLGSVPSPNPTTDGGGAGFVVPLDDRSTATTNPARRATILAMVSLLLSGAAATLSILTLLAVDGLARRGVPVVLDEDVRAYILANPEILVESLTQFEARRQQAEDNELTAVLDERRDEIFDDPASPVGANPTGDAALVEFFDYNCPYCRQSAPILDELEQADRGLRLVFKELPILGLGSTFAALAALASQRQGKYLAFHKALMASKSAVTESSTLEIAAAVGLDVEKLKADMNDPAIEQAIARNLALAEVLRITGTPTFVAGKEILRGYADADTMRRLIAAARDMPRPE